MGGFFETDKMKKHVAGCAQCKAATRLMDRCDTWSEMMENVVDFECNEGPWEDREGWRMCDSCDGPIDPAAGRCTTCDYSWCVAEVDGDFCGEPAAGETDNVGGHGSFPYCQEHRPAK